LGPSHRWGARILNAREEVGVFKPDGKVKKWFVGRCEVTRQHDRITRGLVAIGACWAIRSDKFCGANDPFDDQVAGRKTYHVHADAAEPRQDEIQRFGSLRQLERWIAAQKAVLALIEQGKDEEAEELGFRLQSEGVI